MAAALREGVCDQIDRQLKAEGRGPLVWKTVPQGAATSVWAGVVAHAEEVGGKYCETCQVRKWVPEKITLGPGSEGVRGYALDSANAAALWKKSEQMVGESF